ncbi:hypothetical protein ACFVVU_26885 [Kitasatospora sp. NPDC057965]|uniref:hypothetical protein n=1 Tax=Kitasatospora sp. NPDC057965 TaxID=3346291 RepID=UPI0036DEFA17
MRRRLFHPFEAAAVDALGVGAEHVHRRLRGSVEPPPALTLGGLLVPLPATPRGSGRQREVQEAG